MQAHAHHAPRQQLTPARLVALVIGALVAIAVVGEYAFDWSWSGFGRHREL